MLWLITPLLVPYRLTTDSNSPSIVFFVLSLICSHRVLLASLRWAHHVVSKSGLFLARIRMYPKSLSQTCDCGGSSWNILDFAAALDLQPCWKPVVILQQWHEMICDTYWIQLYIIFVGHHVCLYRQFGREALWGFLIHFPLPFMQSIILCCGCPSALQVACWTSEF